MAKKVKKSEHSFDLEEELWKPYLDKGYFIARVIELHKRYVFVCPEPRFLEIQKDQRLIATVAKKFLALGRTQRSFLVAGDRVLCSQKLSGDTSQKMATHSCVVEFRSPRKTMFSRLDPMTKRREHVIGANITQVAIVSSLMSPTVR